MTIIELRAKRATAWEAAKAFAESHTTANGTLSAEDNATYEKMEQEIADLGREIQRRERQDALDAELNKPVNQPITNNPANAEKPKSGRASDEYKEDFGRHLRGKKPLHNVLSESVDADGGYLVPEEFENQIVRGIDETNIIRSIAKVITTAHDRKIPVAVGHSVATWTEENAAFTESNPSFGQKQIDAFKLTDLIRVSTELLQDSAFNVEDYIIREFSYAFGVAEEQAFCVGTGTNQPTGIFTENGGEVGFTTFSATVITIDDVISLIYSLKAPYRKNAVFLMNDATVGLIRKLKDGNGAYLWQPSVQAGQPDKILGFDVYTTPFAPAIAGGALPIAFGDFQNYWIGDRGGKTVQRLNELYATNGQVGYVATERVDGKVILPEAIKLLKMKS
ncbi:MAG: phage major capsid protein [Ruminococcus sp.]|nr:phage major capsid protein [Ruminococcus sp.]